MFNFEPNNPNSLEELKTKAINLINDAETSYELKSIIFHLNVERMKILINQTIEEKFLIKNADLVETITGSIIGLAKTIEVETVIEFLEKCAAGGIIDIHTLLNHKDGIFHFPMNKTKYRLIIETLLNINISNGNASIGRGEIGIAFMCKNAFKGYTDISVKDGDRMFPVEIKSTRNKTDFFMKPSNEQGSYLDAAYLLIDGVNSVGGNFNKSNKVADNGIAQLNNKTSNMLDHYFQKLGKDRTQELLFNVLSKNYNQIPNFVDQYKTKINESVKESGSVNYDKFKVVTSELNFDYYKEVSHHEGVLMLNVSELSFTYQTSGDQFSKLVERQLLTAISAIDFRTSSTGGLAFKMNL